MAKKTLAELAQAMRDIDFAMLSTRTEGGAIAARPMSNNGEVEYDGDSFFFTNESSRMVAEIAHEEQVGLTFTSTQVAARESSWFIAIEGVAELIRDKAAFAAHWTRDLDRWLEQGIDTPGLIMIKVHANRLHYWDDGDEDEFSL
jgi:general stress protein 26